MNSTGSGASSAPLRARPAILGDVGEIACGPQQLLSAVHFAGQRVLHPRDEMRLVGQVGDHGGHVRRAFESEKGRAALEVDEDEVQRLGRMRGDHARA